MKEVFELVSRTGNVGFILSILMEEVVEVGVVVVEAKHVSFSDELLLLLPLRFELLEGDSDRFLLLVSEELLLLLLLTAIKVGAEYNEFVEEGFNEQAFSKISGGMDS
jgi:hypothetical protein